MKTCNSCGAIGGHHRWCRSSAARKLRTQKIFEFMIDCKIKTDGNSPTVRAIVNHFSLSSTSVATGHLRKLEAEGKITRKTNADTNTVHFCIVGGEWSPPE